MKRLSVEEITKDELLDAISKMLDEKLAKKADAQLPEKDVFITRQQVAEMFTITLVTVHAWVNVGILTPYKIGNKTRFLLREVVASAVPSKKEIFKKESFD